MTINLARSPANTDEAAIRELPERIGSEEGDLPWPVRRACRRLPIRGFSMIFGLLVIGLLICASALAPFIAPHDPVEQTLPHRLQAPSWQYPLGTDSLGRCVFSRLLYGGRISLGISIMVVIVTATLGSMIGLVSGMAGGLVDEVIMRFVDIVLAFPGIIPVMIIAGLLEPGLSNLAIALIVVGWSPFARLLRAEVLVIREKNFIEAATALGVSRWRIAFRHILPNILGPLFVLAILRLGHALLSLAGLSFLGLGAQPPTPEWGIMLSEARRHMATKPLLMLAPGLTIFLATLSVSMAGEGLRLMLDPRRRR